MKPLLLAILIIHSISARTQDKESFYVFDANWKPTEIKSAVYLMHLHQVNDTCWQRDYYNYFGPLIKTEQYRSRDTDDMDGTLYSYNSTGFLDSGTDFRNGKRNGNSWKRFGDNLKKGMDYIYQDDSLVKIINPDTVKNKLFVPYGDEKESEYPGGTKEWTRYLTKNFEYPDRAFNAHVAGQVRIQFLVDKAGYVMDAEISKSVEYSLDEAALNIIRKSGKWEPAFQNGRYVKSYKSQPIEFRLP